MRETHIDKRSFGFSLVFCAFSHLFGQEFSLDQESIGWELLRYAGKRPRFVKKWFKVGGLVLMASLIGACAWLRWKQDAPRRVSLATLQHFGAALDSVDSASLLNHLILPSVISSRTVPEQVEFITKALRDEISPEGIEMLGKRGQFGPLNDLFPIEADGWAKQAGVRVEDCVAFKMERNGLRGEVVLTRELSIQHPVSSNAINIALTYAYDKNGNKTGSTESGTLTNWPPPSLTDETARYTKSGRLIDRAITPIASGVLPSLVGEGEGEGGTSPSILNYLYDPSGNMTNAVKKIGGTEAESWALAYDEDNLTTSICYKVGALCDKAIANRYDALGRRIARTVDGNQTGYVLDLAGGMERILCDLDGTGAITAWYVHGADLAFKVSPAGNLTCYHADAMASIIALPGTNQTLLAQYAFTPYGRTLSSTNFT